MYCLDVVTILKWFQREAQLYQYTNVHDNTRVVQLYSCQFPPPYYKAQVFERPGISTPHPQSLYLFFQFPYLEVAHSEKCSCQKTNPSEK